MRVLRFLLVAVFVILALPVVGRAEPGTLFANLEHRRVVRRAVLLQARASRDRRLADTKRAHDLKRALFLGGALPLPVPPVVCTCALAEP